jgi:alkaline phosphatase
MRGKVRVLAFIVTAFAAATSAFHGASAQDTVRERQREAVELNSAPWGYWGPDASKYSTWTTHSNRLIPVYTFGIDLQPVNGTNSVYRNADKLEALYGGLPTDTLNPAAEYFDQTDVYRLQKLAAASGKKYIILLVFDGMDWWTTWAAANYKAGKVAYREGRGTGLHFQDYRGPQNAPVKTDYGYFVTSPLGTGITVDVNAQKTKRSSKEVRGGYAFEVAGTTPWSIAQDPDYIIGKGKIKHPYTDSSSSATSMTAGIKTYNEAVNVTADGKQVETIAHQLQRQGWSVGVVTSVPISHATPACAYSHNVDRDDYQDLTRDLLGLPSVSHPKQPLPGVDLLLGGGWGEVKATDGNQGKNFVPGNRYLTEADRNTINVQHGGKYTMTERTPGAAGKLVLHDAMNAAIKNKTRLFGFFGVKNGHLPFRTADGNYDPTISIAKRTTNPDDIAAGKPEVYTADDLRENPTLPELTDVALRYLHARGKPFWLMIESGDVDWGNHANNIDNAIGAVHSGDAAFRVITDWVEKHNAWDDTAVIVTADHGHYLTITRPDMLLP